MQEVLHGRRLVFGRLGVCLAELVELFELVVVLVLFGSQVLAQLESVFQVPHVLRGIGGPIVTNLLFEFTLPPRRLL